MNLKKILSFLNLHQKKILIFLFFLMLISTLLELIGLSLIFLILNFLIDNSTIANSVIIEKFLLFLNLEFDIFNFKNLAIILIVAYLTKFIFQIFFFNFQSTFVYKIQTQLQYLLLKKYVSQDYLFFVYRNSSEFTRNIKETLHYFTHGVINPLLNLSTEIILAIGIISLLFYYNFIVSIFVLIFFLIIFFIYYFFIKNISYNLGLKRLSFNKLFFKNLNHILSGIKDIKIYNSEDFYIDKFASINRQLNNVKANLAFLSLLPKSIFEISLIILITLFLYNAESLNIETKQLIELLSLFAIAAIRLLPSITKIFGSIQILKSSTSSVELLDKEFKLKSKTDFNNNSQLRFDNSITLKNLSFYYKNSKESVFDNLNLDIKLNSKIGIVGQSGEGKSTFLDLLVGFIKPNKGIITIDNEIAKQGLFDIKSKLGYITQDPFLLDDTIKNNIVFGYDEGSDTKIKNVLKKVNLLDFVERLPNNIDTLIGERGSTLSGGQAQRIVFARCLYRNPKILILDEATSSLDRKNEQEIFETIKSNFKNLTLIIVSHNKNIINVCDTVYKIENKNIKLINKEDDKF